MQIQFTGRGIEVTEAISNYATNKLSKLDKHYSDILSLHVTIYIDGSMQGADAVLHIRGNDVHASAETHDLYKSIDLLVDKLIKQLETVKGRQ